MKQKQVGQNTMNSNIIPISEIFLSTQGEGPKIGYPTIFVRVYGCNMKPFCSWCIEKETPIQTNSGVISAKKIQVGDKLITPLGETEVTNKSMRTVNKYVRIKLENGKEIKCTVDHPFIDENGNQIQAMNIRKKMKIMAVK